MGAVHSTADCTDSTVQRTEHIYDAYNRPKAQKWMIGGKTRSETYTYDDSADGGSLKQLKTSSGQKINYAYDSLKRLSTTSVTSSTGVALFNTDYTYHAQNSTKSTAQVSSRDITLDISNSPNKDVATPVLNTDYTYDALGNILTATETLQLSATASRTVHVSYIYDEQNQLEAEQYTGAVSDLISYTYDTAGNILNEGHGGIVTKAYTYAYRDTDTGNDAWGDLLVSVDGHAISYDGSGNPTNWYNGTVYTALTWTQGRRLSSLKKGSTSISYAYDMDGVRTTKIAGNEKHEYVTQNGKVVRELVTNKTTGAFIRCLDFLYDESGKPFAMRRYWDASLSRYGTYHYVLNAQGNVVQINYQGGEVKATYTYDAWGQVLTATGELAAMNPIRYRGYYYDTETGFYYVSSRYYDPEIGRWINADIPETLTADFENFAQYNLFAYCFNNPVNMSDETGTWPSWAKKVVAAVAVVAVVAAVAAVTVATAGAGTAAAVIAVGAAKGAAIGMASGAAIGAATGAVSHRVSTGSWSGAGTAALNGMGDGALSGAVTGAITGAAGSAIKVSQAAKAWDSGTFKSGYQSMKYHYNKHVVSEGLTKGNNVLKYTQDAVGFANRNSSVLKYAYNYNYGNASWNLTYSTGHGGMFTSSGKILTFWYR